MSNLSNNALAGIAATIPMTVTIAAVDRYPDREPRRLPPEEVDQGVAKKLALYRRTDDVELVLFTWVSDFAFEGF